MFNSLWIEKYRPSSLSEIKLPDSVLSKFTEYKETGECPNLLFVGVAGIGKTSLAKITVKDVLGSQYLYINASDENGIDTIRNKVTRFAQIRSIDGNIKVIILDEVDGLTIDAQRALRNTMEEYSRHCRFILTANYAHKVIPPLQSRTQSYDVTPSYEQCLDRCAHILQVEDIEFDDDQLKDILNSYAPDLRRCINELQKHIINGKLTSSTKHQIPTFISNMYQLVHAGDVMKLRPVIIENEHIFNKDYVELLRQLFDHICSVPTTNNSSKTIKPAVQQQHLVVVAEHIYRAAFVLDQEINFFSCLVMLSQSR
jgi:replication factor C small subunit